MNNKQNQSISNQNKSVLHELLMARMHAAKAAACAKRATESYSDHILSDKTAGCCFDLTISLINSMNMSNNIINNFESEMEISDEK